MNLPKQAEKAVKEIIPASFLDRADIRFDDINGEVEIRLRYNEIFPEHKVQTGREMVIFLDDQPIKEEF